MEVYIIEEFDITDGQRLIDKSEPYISAEKAMKDHLYRHLEWKYISTQKFSGTILEHWEAESSYNDRKYLYSLEGYHVIGSDD
jgi:hypothetical protein